MADAKKVAKKGSKKPIAKFTIDLSAPVEDRVIDTAKFEEYLKSRIKIHGSKAGEIGTKVVVSRDKSKINVAAELPFSKRYLKYLSKRYLKQQQLRDFLRVIATNKSGFEFKYYKVNAESAEK